MKTPSPPSWPSSTPKSSSPSPPVRALAYLLPVTHGIQLLQDLMLRGSTNHLWQVGALIAIATVTLVAAWLLLRRNMRTA